jgi:hypothetical protein
MKVEIITTTTDVCPPIILTGTNIKRFTPGVSPEINVIFVIPSIYTLMGTFCQPPIPQ